MPRALLSVSDKRGIVPFARGLRELGWEIVSTGGTASALRRAEIEVTTVESLTGLPEMLDGRVKTLHPAVHAGLLARRDHADDLAALARHGFGPIDLVAINLYPFAATIARPGCSFEEGIEQIDIGGPAMLRSAAKNHAHVIPLVDPTDYLVLLDRLRNDSVDADLRRHLAAKVFGHVAEYDSAVAGWLAPAHGTLPERLTLSLERHRELRYGENPGQRAALYVADERRGLRDLVQRHGKELSFNNLLDLDAATWAVAGWSTRPACVIVKHATPCGLALGSTAADAFTKALACDPVSAFGGIVAFNTVVTVEAARALSTLFLEVITAPSFHDEAVALLAEKKALRLVELPVGRGEGTLDFKRVRGGFLVQERPVTEGDEREWKVVSEREPSDREWNDLRFAWTAVASVKSNAILLARDEQSIGIGAGQMSRVDSSRLAVEKAQRAGHDPRGAVLASDGFFPFADGVEEAAAAGITAIIQPGGSVRDTDVIAAANRLGLAMVVTGRRVFRH